MSPASVLAVPELLTASDYSGFLRGDGYAWPQYTAPDPAPLRISTNLADIFLEWDDDAVLQSSAGLIAWTDDFRAFSPHRASLASTGLHRREFFRLRPRGAIHSGVNTGAPQQGFEFTGLPASHWANTPADATTCGWIVPQSLTGFADETEGPDRFVRVAMRSFHDTSAYDWRFGDYDTWEDNAIHQNDGWFHFRVRHPAGPVIVPKDYLLDFEIAWDNEYAFAAGSQLNAWWLTGYAWDWESHDGRHVYRPMYRLLDEAGRPGPWQHVAEADTHPHPVHRADERSFRCRYQVEIPAETRWSEIEVAQNLPYSLADRKRFLHSIQDSYLPQHDDLCIRKRVLGLGGLNGAPTLPGEDPEQHELHAIEIFRKVPGSSSTPDLPNKRILIVLAGLDYEPAGNWAAEGAALEILDKWNTPGQMFKDAGSYVIIPIGDPDGYEWPATHTTPYGNGYADNMIHRGYIFMEGEDEVPDAALDPEMLALRNYIRDLNVNGLDGAGGEMAALLDLQDDICPHPRRWTSAGAPGDWRPYPPVYGIINYLAPGDLTRAEEFVHNLRLPGKSTYTSSYVHNHNVMEGWWKRQDEWNEFGIPLAITFEFDAAVLYSWLPGPPSWVSGGFATPIQIPGPGGGGPTAFYAHGFIDQVGQSSSPDGDPAWVFKQFGRDIVDAAREELMAGP